MDHPSNLYYLPYSEVLEMPSGIDFLSCILDSSPGRCFVHIHHLEQTLNRNMGLSCAKLRCQVNLG